MVQGAKKVYTNFLSQALFEGQIFTAAKTSESGAGEVSPVMDEVAKLYKLFREAKFNHNPGIEAYEKLGENWLGNVQWVSGL